MAELVGLPGHLLDRFPHEVLSNDVELMKFDLREASFPMASRRVNVEVRKPGIALGIVQWIKLELDAHTHYENRPSANAPLITTTPPRRSARHSVARSALGASTPSMG